MIPSDADQAQVLSLVLAAWTNPSAIRLITTVETPTRCTRNGAETQEVNDRAVSVASRSLPSLDRWLCHLSQLCQRTIKHIVRLSVERLIGSPRRPGLVPPNLRGGLKIRNLILARQVAREMRELTV